MASSSSSFSSYSSSSSAHSPRDMNNAGNYSAILLLPSDRQDQDEQQKEHPELRAFPLTRVMVFWISSLMNLASERTLKESDVWDCPKDQSVEHDVNRLKDAWHKEKSTAAKEGRAPTLSRAIISTNLSTFLVAGGFQCLFLCMQLMQPFLVGMIVEYINSEDEQTLEYGIALAFIFGAVAFISSLSLASAFYTLRRLGVSIRSSVMMAVYTQALQLTSSSKLQNTVGQTTNLVAIDAEKLFLSAQFLHFIWHGPVTVICVMCILIPEVGLAPALAGLGMMFSIMPIQKYLAKNIGLVRRGMIQTTDERVKLTNELLQAIRVIKMYAWEIPIEKRIHAIRTKELGWLRKYLMANGYLRELMFVVQPAVVLVIFTILVYGMDGRMSVVQVYKVLAFINITRFPMNLLAQALKNLSDGKVSMERLDRFFLLPTLDRVGKSERAYSDRPKITVSAATFSWTAAADTKGGSGSSSGGGAHHHHHHTAAATTNTTKTNPSSPGHVELVQISKDSKFIEEYEPSFTLQRIDFTTNKPNELIAVIGSVGSGKSTFISALLGETELVEGSFSFQGRCSYCAQTPWIQNMTLRDNVLFGTSWEGIEEGDGESVQERYNTAVDASALRPDIKMLPHGDMTEIGERGVNLSGGQKARVAIARAIFAGYRTEVCLLDDPFSAVDGSTGNWIFKHGIKDALRDKLRIIALNSHMHLLKDFDRILVLEHGRIIADGSPQQLLERHPELVASTSGLSHQSLSTWSSTTATKVNNKDDLEVITDEKLLLVEHSAHDQSIGAESSVAKQEGASSKNLTTTTNSDAAAKTAGKLVKSEKIMTGTVGLQTYVDYFSASVLPVGYSRSAGFYEANGAKDDTVELLLGEDGEKRSKSGAVATTTTTTSSNDDKIPRKSVQHRYSFRKVYGGTVLLGLVLIFIVAQIFRIAIDYYLGIWALSGGRKNSSWVTVYFVSFGSMLVMMLIRSVYLNSFSLRSSENLHLLMLRSVLSAPIPTFFDTHTVGEVLNRFAKDTEVVDAMVPEFMLQVLVNWAVCLSIFGLCIWASPWFALVLCPLTIGFIKLFKRFSSCSRDLKRLESATRSPIYASLSESLSGLDTIRAYSDTTRFITTHLRRMDRNQKLFFHLWMSMSWVTARLELGTCIVLFSLTLLAVFLRRAVSPVALGLALSFSLTLTALFQRSIQLAIDVSVYMTSTERIMEYMDVPQEHATFDQAKALKKLRASNLLTAEDDEALCISTNSADAIASIVPPPPQQQGERGAEGGVSTTDVNLNIVKSNKGNQAVPLLEFINVWMRYRVNNPYILRGISLKIDRGQRIGVCGRTGAGKSSLMLALFRVIEISHGKILMDGEDMSQIPLQSLRSNISIIPQDPVLFVGDLRFQVDPFFQYSDAEVWAVLEQVNLASFVKHQMQNGLHSFIKESGENLSQGQRQLLCIARALLRKTPLLVVDEGTSAVDPSTDEIIQHVLRLEAEKNGTTVFAIAHRISTISDFDRILVLGDGKILEFDTPTKLLSDADSVFYTMEAESHH